MHDHPLRDQIVAEVHARPFQKLSAPLTLSHRAILYDDVSVAEANRVVRQLVADWKLPLPDNAEGFFFTQGPHLALRFEPHSEFYSLTLYALDTLEMPCWPGTDLERLPGAYLCGVEVICRPCPEGDSETLLEQYFGDHQVSGASVMGAAGLVFTDFRERPDSRMSRVLVLQQPKMIEYRCGRLLQRICEIETYRHMALLGLPLSNEVMPEVTRLDQSLAETVAAIAEALVATGVGLLVAIPAVIAFNAFKSRIKKSVAQTDLLGRTLLAHLREGPEPPPGVDGSAT